MGLDWNPGPRAKSGFEAEFEKLWCKLHDTYCWGRTSKRARFDAIIVQAMDTLNTPAVGVDSAATEWARQKFETRVDKSLTLEVFLKQMTGFRVVELLPPCDGLPRYTNGYAGGYVEAYSFRAQFLIDCEDIIGNELLNSAWESKLPLDTVEYGRSLLQCATEFAATKNIDLPAVHLNDEPESVEFHLDVVQSAARWCIYWGERGHWLEAYS